MSRSRNKPRQPGIYEAPYAVFPGPIMAPNLGSAAGKAIDDFATAADLAPVAAKADSAVQSIVAGAGVSVDDTDPQNPVVSATGGGGGSGHLAGTGLVLDTTNNILRVAVSGDIAISTTAVGINTAAGSTATVAVTGGTAPYTWAVSSALPTGLTLNTSTGVITNDGTAATGDVSRTYTVTDANGQQVSRLIVATVAAGDPYWAHVVALLHFDGTDGGTVFTDEKGHSFTAAGNAQIDTAQSKFGGASALFDGGGDYISSPDSADWDFGTGDFTVELFARFVAHTSTTTLVGNYASSASGWSVQRRSDTTTLRFGFGNAVLLDVAWTPTDGTWYHIAVSRAGPSLRAFVDGTQIGSTASDSSDLSGSTNSLLVGALGAATIQQFFIGSLDELRITKGVARYVANFTPPTAPFSNS